MNESMDRALADWLREGPDHGPREGLERTLAATRRTSQRPGWTILERWLPMQLTLDRSPSLRPLLLLATVALMIAALAAAALIVGSRQPPPEPFGIARNGLVAYEAGGDILVADAPGASGTVLIDGPENDVYPVFSLQGDRLAFIRGTPGKLELFVARPDGSDVRSVAGPFNTFDGLRWSPDGTTILIGSTDNGIFRLTVVAVDGSGARTLELGTPADWGSWRPDGSVILFRGQPGDGTQAAAAYLAQPDGSNVRRLDLPASKTSVVDFEGLAWSPDGSRISYMSDGAKAGMGWQMHVVEIDATGEVVADHPLHLAPDSTGEMLPVWSPDASRIAFILERDGQRQIAIAEPVDGAAVTPIGPSTPASTSGIGHGWSPDGRTVLITLLPEGEPQTFWSVDVATGDLTQIAEPIVELPTWQRLAP
jgi:Tol biopolymer transport system component